ncbi:MAG: aromatic ring-hydroxylating dioxygenase subunit alpha [Rhodobacteraceae bacterium]|jgi:phenylpropionate dioxygenase-like ring-hydroxylating dioxygenase large terminal subunit|nr:aromatic ring-hydroxylating dioxygenase subunit alpha [Paracoccaceae bacterium]
MPDDTPPRQPLDPAPYVWTGPPLGQATSLDPRFYTDPAVFDSEMAQVHRKGWLFAGRADMVAQPGSYRAIDTVGGPVLLVRDQDGTLRAFANICRHRNSIMATGCGHADRLTCPYHGWTYRLDGRLTGVPGMQGIPGFRREPHGLFPIRMEVWQGSVFLTFDADAPDLTTWLGNYPDLAGSHGMPDMVCTWEITIETRCNWKLLLENAMETYHTGVVHAQTVGAQTSVSFPTSGEWLAIQVIADRSIATLGDAEPPFAAIATLDAQARKGTYFTLIHPTTQFALAQDCAWWLAVRPLAVDRSVLWVGGMFPRAATEMPDFATRAAPYYARWEAVAREDVDILERQQIGLSSLYAEPGPLSWRDDMVLAMNTWVQARLAGG